MTAGVAAAIVVVVSCASPAVPSGVAGQGGRDDRIAFAGLHWTKRLQPAGSQLYLIGADGGRLRQLTRPGPWSDSAPAWSPDGKRLAFGRAAAAGWRLFVMNGDGGGLRPLTGSAALADQPSWSPDGRLIAFTLMPHRVPGLQGYSQQVYVVPITDGHVRQLTGFSAFKGGAGEPAWSPDGRRILFWGRRASGENVPRDLWLARADGSGMRKLVPRASDPAWSPDGTTIAFSRDGDIYIASSGGGSVRRLTATPDDEDSRPAFSPDGTELAFSSLHRRKSQALDDERIAVVDLDGGGRREITDSDPLFWAASPDWKP